MARRLDAYLELTMTVVTRLALLSLRWSSAKSLLLDLLFSGRSMG